MKLTRRQNILTVVVLVAVLVVTGLDAASPPLLRRELRDVAQEAAGAAARSYLDSASTATASAAARAVTDRRHAVLTGFSVLDGGRIRVTVGDDAKSYYVSRIPQLHHYYVVEVTVTAPAPAGPPTRTTTAP